MPTVFGRFEKGEWTRKTQSPDESGEFKRNSTSFRDRIGSAGTTPHPPEPGRYHLYISWACPWAHRTAIMRSLKGLEEVIGLSVVAPVVEDGDWVFRDEPNSTPDHVNGARFLREIYKKAKRDYTGDVTVPILWDKATGTIVNNESREIMRMFDHEMQEFARNKADYCPQGLRARVDATIDALYQPVNNGVYRAGFATSQQAYEDAVGELFEALEHWEGVLSGSTFLCGETLTEADICLFTTLLRFDAVYHGHFKCNIKRVADFPHLSRHLRRMLNEPGIRATCHLDHIKRHYYMSQRDINPSGIVPAGPRPDFV